MYTSTVFSTLLLASVSVAKLSTVAVPSGTAGTVVAPPAGSPTNTRIMNIYNVYNLAPTVTPLCSIVSADSQSTTYQMTCARGEPCAQFAGPSTVTQGRTAVQYVTAVTHTASPSPSVETLTMSCNMPNSIATCIAKNSEKTSTTTLQVWQQIPAIITSGSFKLANSTNPHATGVTGTGTAAGTGVGTGVLPTPTTSTSTVIATPSITPSTTPSPVPTGAAAANAPVAAGGLAAAGLLLAGLVL